MRSLFLRIYLTFVAGLFVASFGAGILTFALLGSRVGLVEPRLHGFVRQLGLGFSGGFPAGLGRAIVSGDRAVLQGHLAQLSSDVRMRVTVFDAQGQRYASSPREVDPPSAAALEKLSRGEVFVDRHRGIFRAYAPVVHEGHLRGVIGVTPMAAFTARELARPFVWLLAFLAGMAVLTYPVARSMARRIEHLTAAARSISAGQLDARATVSGRDEIATLGVAMNDMASRLGDLVRGQKELVAAVSHELRSPIARLKVSLEMAGNDAQSIEDRARHLAEVEADIADLEALVSDLLMASRLDLADFPLQPEPLDAGAMAHDMGARYQGVDVRVSGDTHLQADGKLLRRVLQNLIENARRASGDAPVEVEVTGAQDRLSVCVRDHGPGVPESERERIFEPFYRIDPSRSRDGGGAGLGLAISRRIALRHGGTLSVSDAPGGGALFTLILPRTPARARGWGA